MVKYYGRAKGRTGSVNTNQIGLNMSGCPSKVGKKGVIQRYIDKRVQCNQKYCGPVFYQGQLWNFNNENCVPKAPRGESFNPGVGHINAPRFSCGQTCKQNLSPDDALCLLKAYYEKSNPPEINMMNVAFAAEKEYCLDLGICDAHPSEFYVLTKGSPEFKNAPPQIQYAITVLNNIQFTAKLKADGEPLLHYVAIISDGIASQLQAKNFGFPLNFGKCNLIAYGLNSLKEVFTTPPLTSWDGKCGLWIESPGSMQQGSKGQGGKNLYSPTTKNNPEYMTAWMYSIWNFVQKQKITKIVVRLPNCGTTPKGYTTDTSQDMRTKVTGGGAVEEDGHTPAPLWLVDTTSDLPGRLPATKMSNGQVPIDITTGLRVPPCPFNVGDPSVCAKDHNGNKVNYPDGIMASGWPVKVEEGEDIWPRWDKDNDNWSWTDAEAAWARLSCTGRNPENVTKASAPYLNEKSVSSIYYLPQVSNYAKATLNNKPLIQTWDNTFAPWTLAWLADKMVNSKAGLESWQWLRASEGKRFLGSNPDPAALPDSYNNLSTTSTWNTSGKGHMIGNYDPAVGTYPKERVWIGSEEDNRSRFEIGKENEPPTKSNQPRPHFAPYPYSFCSKYPLSTKTTPTYNDGIPSYIEMGCDTWIMEASGNDITSAKDPTVGHHKYWTRMQDETYLDLLFQVQVIKIFKKRVLASTTSIHATMAAGIPLPATINNFDTGLLFEFEDLPEQFHRNHGMMPKLATGHKNINSLLSNLVRVSQKSLNIPLDIHMSLPDPSPIVSSTSAILIDPKWRWGITGYTTADAGLSGANNAYAIWDLFNNSEFKTKRKRRFQTRANENGDIPRMVWNYRQGNR